MKISPLPMNSEETQKSNNLYLPSRHMKIPGKIGLLSGANQSAELAEEKEEKWKYILLSHLTLLRPLPQLSTHCFLLLSQILPSLSVQSSVELRDN